MGIEPVSFFEKMPQAFPLYEAFAEKVLAAYPDVQIKVQKSQISFSGRHPLAYVWLPIRRMKNRPDIYIVVSFGLNHRIDSPRITEAVEPYPNRWMHHLVIQDPGEIDEELMNWIREAYNFGRICMRTLNQFINDYTCQLQQGELQIAYKGILEFIGRLRAEFVRKYPHYDVSSIYQGYMDMSYFSLSTKSLKDKSLKIAIVYLHEKGDFEVWLSARNRDIAKSYASVLKDVLSSDANVFHDVNNPDAIVEYSLVKTPDFENPSMLIDTIDQGVDKFVTTIVDRL